MERDLLFHAVIADVYENLQLADPAAAHRRRATELRTETKLPAALPSATN